MNATDTYRAACEAARYAALYSVTGDPALEAYVEALAAYEDAIQSAQACLEANP
jgi:hypothetical protein